MRGLSVMNRRALTAAAVLVILTSVLVGVVQAGVLSGRGDFSADATTITFNDLELGTIVTDQFAADGVTFDAIEVINGSFGLSGRTATNILGGVCPCDDITATFGEIVFNVGLDVVTNPDDDTTLLAFRDGVLVDSFTFDTDLSAKFIGLTVRKGIDALVIQVSGAGGFMMDDFTFEGAPSPPTPGDTQGKAEKLIGSGVNGKGLANSPGQEKDFNEKARSGERAGQKK
jgi:hypothetical protein